MDNISSAVLPRSETGAASTRCEIGLKPSHSSELWRRGFTTSMKTDSKSQDRIRVAHVSMGTNMGGMEKLLVEFARHTDPSRFELHFICLQPRGPLADEGNLILKLLELSTRLLRIPVLSRIMGTQMEFVISKND